MNKAKIPSVKFSMAIEGLENRLKEPAKLAGQNRIRLVVAGFCLAFFAIAAQLANLTILKTAETVEDALAEHQTRIPRPDIIDRNGVVVATDIAVASLYADPRKILDVEEAVESITAIIPELGAKALRAKLTQPNRAFVWLKRQASPEERDAVYNLGIPGIGFVNERRRVYPLARLAAHTVGYVDLDSVGTAGIEKYLDDQGALYTASLADPATQTASPAQISTDTRVQFALTDEIEKAVKKFSAIAGGGIVIDITTGEIVALVSLPDFNPNQEDKKFTKQQANMMTSGVFELGSVIKAVTFAMAFDYGVTDLNGSYDATHPLVIGNASISDYHAQKRILTVPEVFTNSSNIGTAKMALEVGLEGHQEFLRRVGLFDRLTTEVPESAKPLLPKQWSRLATATAAFGHGFAVQPLQGISVIGGLLNDGVMAAPTFLKRDVAEAAVLAKRIVKPKTSEKMRYLFRLNVTDGTASKANVVGYRVGGKTGTAEKVVNGRYVPDKLLNSFIGAFPMEAPRYAIIVMLDEPKATSETFGFATAGWNAVPTAGKIIERIAPLLGVAPKFTPEEVEKLAKK
jgi:cell division protein FtsI (penicillin-binding protein 3)